jgi:hypothetical protein
MLSKGITANHQTWYDALNYTRPYFIRIDIKSQHSKKKRGTSRWTDYDDEYRTTITNIYCENKTDKILFTLKPHAVLTEEEFEQFRELNGMANYMVRYIKLALPFCLLDIPEREASKQFRPRASHFDEQTRKTREVDTITPEWNKLKPLLQSIISTRQSVISSEISTPLASTGYTYELYWRMYSGQVWYMKLEIRSYKIRYTHVDE